MVNRKKRRRRQKITWRVQVVIAKGKVVKKYKKIVGSKMICVIIKVIKNGYKIITVITTLFAFICVPIFVYGLIARSFLYTLKSKGN